MEASKNICNSCGMMLETDAKQCSVCGSYNISPQVKTSGVNHPVETTSIPTPAQSPNYSYPQNSNTPPANYNLPPNQYQQPLQGSYNGNYPTPMPVYPMQRQPKKKNTLLIVLLIAIPLVIVSFFIFILAFLYNVGNTAIEYENLENEILSSYTPEDVAFYNDDLNNFKKDYPEYVNSNVVELMKICVAYENLPEKNYENIDNTIEKLLDLPYDEIMEDCVNEIVYYLIDTQTDLLASEFEMDTAIPNVDDVKPDDLKSFFSTADSALQITDEPIIANIDGTPSFSFNVKNISSKEIVYFEAWVFCYDENGEKFQNTSNNNVEWIYDDSTLLPGDTLTDADGFWELESFPESKYVVPYISYIEYADGTTYGITDSDDVEASDIESLITLIGFYANIYVESTYSSASIT